MSDFSAKQLHDLVGATHTLLRLYYDKEKWPKLFPLISLLAEQYDNAYISNPRALQAQLMFYISKQGFTTNLIINQTILCCMFCHAASIPSTIRQGLIASCLIHLMCAQKESNQLANNEALTPQGKKLWVQRHLLTLKLMQTGKVKQPIIYHALNKLASVNKHFLGQKEHYVLDELTCIVALSELLARKITLSKSAQAISLNDALKNVYCATDNENVQNLLKKLIKTLPSILPGSCYQQNNQLYLYIDSIDEQTHLSFHLSERKLTAKGHWQESKEAPSQTKFTQKACLDEHLIFSLWFRPLEKRLVGLQKASENEKQSIEEQSIDELLVVLERFRIVSLEQLLKICDQSPNLAPLICQYASARTGQNIYDLKHAILLLGPARIPEIIKKITLIQAIDSLNLPNQSFFETRLNVAIALLEHLAKDHHHLFSEQSSCALLKYVLVILQSNPHLFFNTSSNERVLKSSDQLSPNPFLLLSETHTELTITKDLYLSTNWHSALTNLTRLPQLEANTYSVELACLIITCACINRIYFKQVDSCTLSNNILQRAFATLGISECKPNDDFHLFFSNKYNLNPFNSL